MLSLICLSSLVSLKVFSPESSFFYSTGALTHYLYCIFTYNKSLTCLNRLKESNVLLGQSPKQLHSDSTCESTNGTEKDAPSAACTHRAKWPNKKRVSQIVSVSHRNMVIYRCGGQTQSFTFPESTRPWRGLQIWIHLAGTDGSEYQWLSQCRMGWTSDLRSHTHTQVHLGYRKIS